MKEFALVFRQPDSAYRKREPGEMDALQKKWDVWAGGIAVQGKYANSVRLAGEGQVLKPGGLITDGPFVEIREILGGVMIVHADSLEEATTLAHGCPALDAGGSIEIRPLYT
jgi:hypothetical protein